MAYMLNEATTRLQATAFVQKAELAAVGRGQILRTAARELAERALQKLLNECVTTTDNYLGYSGQHLSLDVYVLAPAELHRIVADARAQGERDACRWYELPATDTATEAPSPPSPDEP